MTADQWLVLAAAAGITALPWALFIIGKMMMKPDEDND
jgi:hypothetical protein